MSNTNTIPQPPAPASHEIPEQLRSPVATAIAEAQALWDSTDTAILGARGCLYEFLGATYEHAAQISRNPSDLRELRLLVRREYASDRDKRRAERASAEELILAKTLGVRPAQQSLRSKYKKLLANAHQAAVGPHRESFKQWLTANGGIVDALRVATDAPATKTPKPSETPSFHSCAGDLLRYRHVRPPEQRVFTQAPHHGFALVLFYVDPSTKEACVISEVSNTTLVERAVCLISEQQSVPAPAEVA